MARAKDVHHFEEIEKLKAMIKNERGKHESLEGMVQTLKQQKKSCIDKFMVDWQSCEDGWKQACHEIQKLNDKWEAEN